MAGRELGSEEIDEEELPTLASIIGLSPDGLSCQRPSPPHPEPGLIVVESSEEEDEVVEVPLSERIKRRGEVVVGESSEEEDEVVDVPLSERDIHHLKRSGEVVFKPPQLDAGDAANRTGFSTNHDLVPSSEAVVLPDVSCGDQNGTGGSKGPSLCPPAAVDQPSRPLVSEASPERSPSPKKPKYSQKKKKAICQAVRQRRKEQETRRRQQEQEKERKRATAKMLKAQRPGECQKYITVVLDPALLEVEGGGQILSALQAANYSCVVESQAVPCSVTWRRKTLSSQMEDGDEWTEEPNVLVLLHLEEFLSMVQNYKQEAQGCTERQKDTLQSYVARVMEKMPGKILALQVVGVENYFRVQSKKTPRRAAAGGNQEEEQGKRRKKQVKDSGLEITRRDVEEALVDLQLSKIQVNIFESCEELGEFATMLTKAVAEAPFRREREKTDFSFYLDKQWCGGVRVDCSGKGLLEVWKRQIQQFNRVSLEMADAIVSAYPSPQLLVQAYSRCSSEQERENMLANILVHRGEGVTATSRRIGPELSRRIYLQMTSDNPDLYLDFTG